MKFCFIFTSFCWNYSSWVVVNSVVNFSVMSSCFLLSSSLSTYITKRTKNHENNKKFMKMYHKLHCLLNICQKINTLMRWRWASKASYFPSIRAMDFCNTSAVTYNTNHVHIFVVFSIICTIFSPKLIHFVCFFYVKIIILQWL